MTAPNQRICLFAGYSPTNEIDSNTVHYIRELSRFADVYYMSADAAPDQELARLEGITKGRWSEPHGKYDFGSWQKLMFRLGWDHLSQYDHLIITNDSNLGPLSDLERVFGSMDAQGLDVWGITENYGVARHMQSYFVSFAQTTVSHPRFRTFFESIAEEASKTDICQKYEIGLSQIMSASGLTFGSFIDRSGSGVPDGADITAYQNLLVRMGSPFVKRKVFTEPGFAAEDVNVTRVLLRELGYPEGWLEGLKRSEVHATIPATASGQVASSIDGAGRTRPANASLLRRAAKAVLTPFYGPFKARIIDPLSRVEHHAIQLAKTMERLEVGLSSLRKDVDAMRSDTSIPAIQGQLAALSMLVKKIDSANSNDQ